MLKNVYEIAFKTQHYIFPGIYISKISVINAKTTHTESDIIYFIQMFDPTKFLPNLFTFT